MANTTAPLATAGEVIKPISRTTLLRAADLLDGLDVRPETIAHYKRHLGLFFRFIRRQGLKQTTLFDFKKYLAGRDDFAISTKNQYLIAAKKLAGVLYSEGLIPANICQHLGQEIKTFKQGRAHKKFGLTEAELKAVWQADMTPKQRAIIALLVFEGLRTCEIVRLNCEHLNLSAGTARITGKGQDDTSAIYLNPNTTAALKAYLKAEKRAAGALFAGQRGRHGRTAIYRLVLGILGDCKIVNSPHGFRHGFATLLIEGGMNLLSVIKFTRHASTATLQPYYDAVETRRELPAKNKILGTIGAIQ